MAYALRLLTLGFVMLLAGAAAPAWAEADDDDSASGPTAPAGDDDDSASPAKASQPPPTAPQAVKEICDDDKDNDGDGLVDCKDLNDCASFLTCGRIQGGWGWVISSYGISFAALLLYTLMVTLRLRSLQRRGDH